MLVVSRKAGERLVIDGDIVLTVVWCGANRVRLAIAAPPSVGVTRPDAKSGPAVPATGRGRRTAITPPG